MNLREETRVVQQGREALSPDNFRVTATHLAETQDTLRNKLNDAIGRIKQLPDGVTMFAKEVGQLSSAAVVMKEASEILARPDTGSDAIAAETEVIEILLATERINPKGAGGGGGNTPGGGGGGDTSDAALALVGAGRNEKEVREMPQAAQSTGDAGVSLPEEFRAGLDEYFSRLDESAGSL